MVLGDEGWRFIESYANQEVWSCTDLSYMLFVIHDKDIHAKVSKCGRRRNVRLSWVLASS